MTQSPTAAPRTLSELAAAYYRDMKTTIEEGEPLRSSLEFASDNVPYFERGFFDLEGEMSSYKNVYYMILVPQGCFDRHKFVNLIMDLSRKNDIGVASIKFDQGKIYGSPYDVPAGGLTISVIGGSHIDKEKFESFAKGLGILLRAATQHKREEACGPGPALQDFFL